MILDLFDKSCTVKRNTYTLGERNRPIWGENIIGTYPCKQTRQTILMGQVEPQNNLNFSFRIYTVPSADIQAGDIITVDGIDYVASPPYTLSNHMEVDITKKGEA